MLRRLSADELAEFQANMTPARLGEFKICLAMVELSKDLTEDCRAAATLRRLTISLEEFISWIIEECEFAQLGLFAKIQAIIAKPRAALTAEDLLSLGTPYEYPTVQKPVQRVLLPQQLQKRVLVLARPPLPPALPLGAKKKPGCTSATTSIESATFYSYFVTPLGTSVAVVRAECYRAPPP